MYIPHELNKDELACDRRVLMQRYYAAHPEEVEKVLQEEMDAMLVPLRTRMDLMQGQIVYIQHRIDELYEHKTTRGERL